MHGYPLPRWRCFPSLVALVPLKHDNVLSCHQREDELWNHKQSALSSLSVKPTSPRHVTSSKSFCQSRHAFCRVTLSNSAAPPYQTTNVLRKIPSLGQYRHIAKRLQRSWQSSDISNTIAKCRCTAQILSHTKISECFTFCCVLIVVAIINSLSIPNQLSPLLYLCT